MIYSTSVLWDMLDSDDRKILGHFVRACNLLVSRIITEDDLNEAQERLKDMAYLIENAYGRILNNIYIGQMKISKFTMINKQTIFTSAKQTLIMTSKKFFLLSNS